MCNRNWLVAGLLAGVLFLPAVAPAQVPELEREWTLLVKHPVDSTPAIGKDGTLYFGSFEGKLWAVSVEGKVRWTFVTGHGSPSGIEIRSSPAIADDGTIYFGCRDHKLYALDNGGKLKFAVKTAAWVDSSPAIGRDGRVYFGSWDKKLYAINPEGKTLWQFETGGPVVSSPAIAVDGTILFGSHDGSFYALDPQGKLRWKYPAGGPVISSPAVGSGGEVYFTSANGFCHALNPDGSPRWKLHTGGFSSSSPAIANDGSIVLGVNKEVWNVSTEGRANWKHPVTSGDYQLPVEATPAPLGDGTVVYLSRVGWLSTRGANGVPLKATDVGYTGYSSPVVSPGGHIYATGLKQNVGYFVVCLRNGSLPAKTAWPKFRGDLRNTGRAGANP